jgi:hypothetical protein
VRRIYRDRRFVLRLLLARRFRAGFFRREPVTACFAVLPAARFIAGVDCRIFVRPASSAFAADSSTTTAAALAAAPSASPATDLIPFAPRRAAPVTTCRAFVVILTM